MIFSTKKIAQLMMFISGLVLCWACSSSVDSQAVAHDQTIKQEPPAEPKYVIGPGDILDINVYQEPDMSSRIRVRKSGEINFPFIGMVEVKGKTASEVEEIIANGLKGDYLISPVVTIQLSSYRKFFVSGQVEDPDGYDYQDGLTVEKALALAGGFTDRADRDDVEIRRSNSKDTIDAEMTTVVFPGDTIIVGMSFF